MLSKIKILQTYGTDPYENLAIEQMLTEKVQAGEILLYLWQNERTVVIGRNQNAWKEVDLKALSGDGGKLARRFSGGGAVFHDLGNLNFSFCVRKEDYHIERQLEVIAEAVRSFGIPAVRTGRNDLEACGRKFSGNAFLQTETGCCHHGTIMLTVDQEKLGRYLTVSEAKLKSKGVDSVLARVVNLMELCPDLTVARLSQALQESVGKVYGLPIEMTAVPTGDALREKAAYLRSWDWLYGRRIPFTLVKETQLSWGNLEVEMAIDRGRIQSVICYSDALDVQLPRRIEESLTGCRFQKEALKARLQWDEALVEWVETWL